jgi:hypothetical protein
MLCSCYTSCKISPQYIHHHSEHSLHNSLYMRLALYPHMQHKGINKPTNSCYPPADTHLSRKYIHWLMCMFGILLGRFHTSLCLFGCSIPHCTPYTHQYHSHHRRNIPLGTQYKQHHLHFQCPSNTRIRYHIFSRSAHQHTTGKSLSIVCRYLPDCKNQ